MKRNQNILDAAGLVVIILALVALHSSGAWTGFAHGADSDSRGRNRSHRHHSNDRWNSNDHRNWNDRWNSDDRRDSSDRRQSEPQSPNATPQNATLTLVSMESDLQGFTDMEVADGAAYLGANPWLSYSHDLTQGLTLLNVSDPSHPLIAGVFQSPETGSETHFWGAPIAISNGLMTLDTVTQYSVPNSHLRQDLSLLDVSAPLFPVFKSRYPIDLSHHENFTAIFSPDNTTFLFETGFNGVSLQTLSDSTNPQWITSKFPYRDYCVWEGNLLLGRSIREDWESTENKELIVLDMTNPLDPSIIFRDTHSLRLNNDMHASGGIFYVVDGLHGVFTVSAWNFGGGEFDEPVGRYHGFRTNYTWDETQMAGVGSLIVLVYAQGIDLISFADPSAPRLLERQFLGSDIVDVEISDGHVYMLSTRDGLFIFRIDSQP